MKNLLLYTLILVFIISVNANLDRSALLVAKKLQKAGFGAYPIPASQYVNTSRLEGAISHKLVVNLAGLGWIGKNCLLITPKNGPRLRFATVLTDAPLKPGTSIPNPFNPSEPRDVRFRAHLCRDYSPKRREQFGVGICGLCVYICPWGRTRENNSITSKAK